MPWPLQIEYKAALWEIRHRAIVMNVNGRKHSLTEQRANRLRIMLLIKIVLGIVIFTPTGSNAAAIRTSTRFVVVLPHPELAGPQKDCTEAVRRNDFRYVAYVTSNKREANCPGAKLVTDTGVKVIIPDKGSLRGSKEYEHAAYRYCVAYNAMLEYYFRHPMMVHH